MIDDLVETLAGIAEGILSGLEGRGPAATFQGPSLYEFIDDLLRAFSHSGVQRVDDHMLGLRDAVLVFEVIEEEPEHQPGTSLEELDRRGIRVVVSHPPDSDVISFHGESDGGGRLEGRIVLSRDWAFLIASSSEEAAAELARMVDERLGLLLHAED